MVSFSNFGVPIAFAALLALTILVGISCVWDWRSVHPLPTSDGGEAEIERGGPRPELRDVFTEVLVGRDYTDAMWRNVTPFSVSLSTTESPPVPPTIASHLQLAVTIAMPCAPRSLYLANGQYEQPIAYCIGVHAMVVNGSLDISELYHIRGASRLIRPGQNSIINNRRDFQIRRVIPWSFLPLRQ
ncbi:hypothetical protein C8J57DRAFT_1322518 [Mycena rebaudengoi]|nr:hypothetical protein C8J57DRAFT_1322518 [Mycena rebaudengoi]